MSISPEVRSENIALDDKMKYISLPYYGKATFDYSQNNGIYTIGEGLYLFEIMWKKASGKSIHAYNDPVSVDGVSLAKGITEIADIKDASTYDYSCRSRMVNEGQILLIRNINNIYAALKVLDVKDDSRKDTVDEVTFEYMIQKNGLTRF